MNLSHIRYPARLHRKALYATLMATCLLITSCGLLPWETAENTPKAAPATIGGINHRANEQHWQSYNVAAIDEKQVSAALVSKLLNNGKIEVSAGMHKVVVAGRFDLPESQCPCEAYAEFEMEFEAGADYVVVGKFIGERLRLWIANTETKKPVVPHADVKWRKAL